MDGEHNRSSPLRGYVNVFRRRRRLVVGVFLTFVGAFMAVSFLTTPQYEATAQLRYSREPDITSAINGTQPYASSYDTENQLATTAKLVTTNEMTALAADNLDLASPDDMDTEVTATPIIETSLLAITAASPDPVTAAAVANAYAEALIETRHAASLAKYVQAQKLIAARLKRYVTHAQRADPAYGALTYRMQDVVTLKALARGDFVIAAAATTPTSPARPVHSMDLLIASALGGVIAVFCAFIAEQLDTRVREIDEIAHGLQLPVVGRIPKVSKDVVRSGALAVALDPGGQSAEAFRILRGNLDFVDIDREVSSVIITSCTTAEGKTSTAGNLAISMARVGKRVVVVDADLRRPQAHLYFGVDNDVGLTSVVAGRVPLSEAMKTVIVSMPEVELRSGKTTADEPEKRSAGRLQVLPSGPLPPNPGDIVISKHFDAVITDLETKFDVVLVDAPPFLAVGDAAALARRVDGVLLVVKIGAVSRSNLRDAAALLKQLPSRKLGVVLTNASPEVSYYRGSLRSKAPESSAAPQAAQGL